MKKKSKKNNKGYTITGLLAVIAILSVVVCLFLYFFMNVMHNEKNKRYQVTISSVEKKANNYVANNNDEIFYLSTGNGKVEYQCVTVGNLIEMGYLDSSILDTEIDSDGNTVSVDDYIYIEKNTKNNTILKSIYDKNNNHHCENAVNAKGDITFTVSPSINTWSRNKTINITYKVKNNNDNKKYQYKYTVIDETGREITIKTTATQNEEISIDDKATINAEIIDKNGKILTQKTISIGMVDNVGPTIALNGAVITGNVNSIAKIPLIVTDTQSGINGSSIDKTDFKITIGGSSVSLASIQLTKVSEQTNEIKYELIIADSIHRGELKIEVPENSFFDEVENGNIETTLNLHLTMNKVYKVVADGRGGIITSTTGWTGTGASAYKNVTYGNTYGMLPNISKPGYSLIGWYTSTSGSEKITSNSLVTINQTQILYARWQANNYKVTLIATGGAINSTSGWTGTGASAYKNISYGSNYGLMPVPTRTGYTFAGWYTSSSGGTQVTSTTQITSTSSQTLYARWTTATYKVTLNATGGTITSNNGWTSSGSTATKNLTYTSQYGPLPTPTKAGYIFAGWYTSTSGGTKITETSRVTTATSHNLYARWTVSSYKVIANPTGGTITSTSSWTITGSSAYKYVTYNSQYGILPTPTKAGYTFAGWYTSTSGGTKIESSTKVTATSIQTIYARWTAGTYNVTANANGGRISSTSSWTGSGSTAIKNIVYGSQYGILPTVSRTGYTFAGWYTSASGGTQITSTTRVTSVSSHTIYAKWTANTYRMVANANGGSISSTSGWTGTGASATKVLTFDSAYGPLPTPTRTGYTFAGWYTGVSSGTQVTASTKLTSATVPTIYARWTINKNKVTLIATGGTISSTSGWMGTGASTYKMLTYNSQYGLLPTPTRTGYTFTGWYTSTSGGTQIMSTTFVTATGDQTLYAQWTSATYKVVADATGGTITNASGWTGTGASATKNVMYNSQYGILPIPTKAGYTFAGWYTSASGGTKIESSTRVTTATTHLIYARWTSGTYRVTANATGGSISSTSGWTGTGASVYKNVMYNSQYGILPTPTKAGYTFAGWYTSTSGGTKIESSTRVTTATTHAIYARWTSGTYRVTANATGGSISSTSGWTGTGASVYKNVMYNSQYGILPTPTRTGYTFAGWYTSTSGGTRIESSTTVTTATTHTIYARWTSGTYRVIANATGGTITSTSGWTGSGGSAYKNVMYNSQYGILPTPTRTGYTFAGWYTSTSGGTRIESSTTVTTATTHAIYARWTSSNCTLNFNKNTSSSTIILNTTTKTIPVGSQYGTLDVPTNTATITPGETYMMFDGWWTSATGGTQVTSTTICNIPSTTTIYAHWSYAVIPVPQN